MRTANLTGDNLAGITRGLIYPSTVPVASAVDNNWVSERKYLFWLKSTVEDSFNVVHHYYLQGYTSHDGITNSGVADHRMDHVVNTIVETVVVEYNTPQGVLQSERLDRVYNVAHGSHWNTDSYLQRPSDIFNSIELNLLTSAYDNYGSFENIQSEHTSTTVRSSDVVNKTSLVTNNVPTMFLADVLNVGLNSMAESAHINQGANESSFATQAMNRSTDPDIKNNQFLRTLSHVNNTRRYGVFTFGELTVLDRSIEDRFQLLNITKEFVDVSVAGTPSVGEYWHGQDATTLMAYSIIEATVSLATRYGFSKMHFSCSNTYDPTGTPYVIISNYKSLINLGQAEGYRLVELFKSAFLSNVFMDETRNNTLPLSLHVYVDVFGTSKVAIVDSYGRDVWYTIPTFANTSFSPILTVDKANLDNLGVGVTGMVDWLGSNLRHRF
jgi:hypothetical protein